MDVHSRHTQFDIRKPRSGPVPISAPFLSSRSRTVTKKSPLQRSSSHASMEKLTDLSGERPIKTNSRIQKEEKYKKDMYLVFVKNALVQKSFGNSETYIELLSQFDFQTNQATTSTVAQLRLWITALSNVVSQLDASHSKLVGLILDLPWSTLDSSFVKAYLSFVGHLVSARPEYLGMTLDKCVQGFTHESKFQEHAAKLAETSSSSSVVTRRTVYDRHHALLQHLHDLIPTLPSALQPYLRNHFPHKRFSKACQTTYIRNLLRVIGYCPSLSERVLSNIIDRAIQIDVEIQLDIDELEEAESQDDGQHHAPEVFDIDPFDTNPNAPEEDDSDADSSSSDEFDLDDLSDGSSEAGGLDFGEDEPTKVPNEIDYPHIRDMVDKLDAIMKLLFEHFSSRTIVRTAQTRPDTPTIGLEQETLTRNDEEADIHRTVRFFTLLSIFDNLILRTLRSRYTQFLLFWYASLDAQYLDVFQGMLISKAFLEIDAPVVIRLTATSYIASFVARAKFVDGVHVRHVVRLLSQHLEDQLESLENEDTTRPIVTQYPSFYAVSQALFLIFCFRWRDLEDRSDEDDIAGLGGAPMGKRKWVAPLQILPKIVNSVLNPLKICAPDVVKVFARIAHRTGFMYIDPILEANKRADGPSGSGLMLGDSALTTSLTTFFPFDPYQLHASKSWIEGIYRTWSSVDIEEDDDDNEEESDEEGSVTTACVGHGVDVPGEPSGLGKSFEAMSISPARPKIGVVS